MATTIQHLVAHSRLLNELIANFGPVVKMMTLSNQQLVTWSDIVSEGKALAAGLQEYATANGAGLFPNTFQRTDLAFGKVYMIVNTPEQESAALIEGWRPATFPQTMTRAGLPDVVVHNSIEKFNALNLGYSLPGLK